MKPSKHQLSALIALASVVVAAPSAMAVLSYASDDLFIGFHQTGNTAKEYIINIGQASTYRDATTPITLSLNAVSFAADMQAAFGAGWRTSGDVFWGVAGTTQNTAQGSDPIRLLYASEPTGGTAPAASSSQSGPSGAIISFKNNWQTNGIAGSVSNSATLDPTISTPPSWTNSVGNAAGPFGTGALNPLEALLATHLDLFRMPQTTTGQSVTNEGTFAINFGANTISFVPQVPEPSSAVLAGFGLLVWIARSRYRRASVARFVEV